MRLLDGATGDGAGAEDSVGLASPGGASKTWTFFVWGTFDGATVTPQISPDGNEWFDVTSFTEKGMTVIEAAAGRVRAMVSGAGASTDLNAELL